MTRAEELLDRWERCVGLSAFEAACALLDVDGGAALGERNRELLRLRASLFGPRVRGYARCAHCQEATEIELDVEELLAQAPAVERAVEIGGREVIVRPLTIDAVRAALRADPSVAPLALASACIGEGVELDASEIATVVEVLGAIDPLADPRLAIACSACGRSAEVPLDVASFVRTEIDVHARRLLDDIATLASAYGWAEREILGMSGAKRREYLARVRPWTS